MEKLSTPNPDWSVVYRSSGYSTGRLLFPERLPMSFLERQRRVQGSYIFFNQYENVCIPDDERRFKPNWLKPYTEIPKNHWHFAFIDPAIGQKKHHDYTGIVVIAVDWQQNWYVKVASRYRLTPTEIVNKMFELHSQFHLMGLGVEGVAYQEALIYLTAEEMRKRKIFLPMKDIKRQAVSKETRILGLVPRFEFGNVYLNHGLMDFEDEYNTFPRGKFDDLLDALASCEEIVHYPIYKEVEIVKPNHPGLPEYESWHIRQAEKSDEDGTTSSDDYDDE